MSQKMWKQHSLFSKKTALLVVTFHARLQKALWLAELNRLLTLDDLTGGWMCKEIKRLAEERSRWNGNIEPDDQQNTH